MHELQKLFATEEGEAAWTQFMLALFGAGAFEEAEARLAQALSALDTELAWACLELPRAAVELSGWEEMAEAIDLHEGDPVTGVTIAIANENDRAFEKGQMHHPYVLLGLYTDEAYPFSKVVHWQLLDECHAEMPGWAGKEEDVEVHMDIDGLDALNTFLVHHKQRHFLRDGKPAAAPARYVEFVLACWWRALRWHQAVAAQAERHGLPRGVPVIAGMVGMRPEAVAIHASGEATERDLELVAADAGVACAMAQGFGEGFIQRKPVEEEEAPKSGSDIRRRALAETAEAGVAERAGLWARLFGRR